MPAYQLLVNTEFFVPVLQKDSGNATQDFRFAVRGDINNAPMLVISEEMSRLHAQGTTTAIKMRGSELISRLHPQVGIIVALSNGGFGLPAEKVQWLKRCMQPA